ncbi:MULTISPECIES: hydroxymethylpyrimidine/phosphomethylpyrimidine kinase [unclassified Mesorhizobium]|uniref:hydroxymethylpyrimidine/phosphomethylpyrimidine kinase n=1 Tax=unclassified Mesorhizobium TaxID=325217 RepID=UPI001FCE1FE8|nr:MULTISPECIES: hydroxymethylpyrimidine/phosphomethylpyrimidine kinase [unclassified Mesorhizobium]
MDRGDGAMAMTKHVLIVAGSDASGGAGIARDIETVSAFGLRACLAVTAITVQTHREVGAVELVQPDLVAAQMRAALEANEVAAIKLGMLGTAAIIDAVTAVLDDHPTLAVVLDPVLATTSGRLLLDATGRTALKGQLLPLCRLVTPNLPELALLTQSEPAGNEAETIHQAGLLVDQGARAVLVKGGHGTGDTSTDILVERGISPVSFDAPRIDAEMRGTGCMLASAIAANIALGRSLEESVSRSKAYVLDRLTEQISARQTA